MISTVSNLVAAYLSHDSGYDLLRVSTRKARAGERQHPAETVWYMREQREVPFAYLPPQSVLRCFQDDIQSSVYPFVNQRVFVEYELLPFSVISLGMTSLSSTFLFSKKP